jgi:hypothetical protein
MHQIVRKKNKNVLFFAVRPSQEEAPRNAGLLDGAEGAAFWVAARLDA